MGVSVVTAIPQHGGDEHGRLFSCLPAGLPGCWDGPDKEEEQETAGSPLPANTRKVFLNKDEPGFEDLKGDWLEGRNFCREYCMDLVSLETEEENTFFFNYPRRNKLDYIWTSGRLCDFKGCDRADLQPVNINGWFWTGSNKKIPPTNSTPPDWSYQPWSDTGHLEQPQPDNAEEDINGSKESCLGLLNNIYDDGVKWHDIACYHPKPFMCEDSDALLDYVAATNEGIRL